MAAVAFQSTFLSRGTTTHQRELLNVGDYFNPRSSREERRFIALILILLFVFQSTFLSRGTTPSSSSSSSRSAFQSTFLSRGTTAGIECYDEEISISIHVSLARNDSNSSLKSPKARNFNPRSSREERHDELDKFMGGILFQSTSLSRGTTEFIVYGREKIIISIHVPLARDDFYELRGNVQSRYFNPRPSREGRRGVI